MGRMLRGFVADETGQDLVEYALLSSLLAVVSVAALKILGEHIPKQFAKISAKL